MTGPPLLTDRLLLRDFVEDDWRAVHEYDADPDVVYFMAWAPNSEQDSRDFVGRNITASRTTPRTDFALAVVEQDASRLVGGAGLGVTSARRVVSFACGHSNATAVGANVSGINRLMVFLCSNGTGR
ncbi:MAG: GNAT family N-acetyltransferase [Candidatus Latescibacterota bacterium]